MVAQWTHWIPWTIVSPRLCVVFEYDGVPWGVGHFGRFDKHIGGHECPAVENDVSSLVSLFGVSDIIHNRPVIFQVICPKLGLADLVFGGSFVDKYSGESV